MRSMRDSLKKSFIYRLAQQSLILWLLSTAYAAAAPGDILFTDDFEGGLANWTITSGGGDAGISSATANSGNNSLFTRWQQVLVTSNTIDTSFAGQIQVTAWIQKGDDNFSENPEDGEDLFIQYLDSGNNWVSLDTYLGGGTPGEIFNLSATLTGLALHSNFRIRIGQTAGSNSDWDYWHIDDVEVTELALQIAGLIGEWQFDELFWNGTNSEVTDASGNGLHLTAFDALTGNAIPAIAGDPGTCSYGVFNGNVSFIQLDDDTSTADSLLDIPDNLTVTTWINTNVIPGSGLKSILSKDENYEFHINSSGQIFWWWSWATLTTTGPSLNTNQWYHIAITWRSGEQVIYIDGAERARSARTGSLNLNNDPLQVGQDLDIAERFFDGEIDEVRIYENFLNVTEINQIMNETRPCISSGICTLTFEDSFSAAAYNNSTGSQPWASDWIEQDDDNNATSGNIRITGGALTMDDNPNSGGEPSLERELNLSGYIDAFITVDLTTSGTLTNGDRFDISASADGGANYTILNAFRDDFSGNFSYDLTPYMTANARIRFRVENGYGNGVKSVSIDNVIITGQKNCGPDHFTIAHDGAGINCLREAITIRAENADGSLVTDYSGSIDLSTITSNGNWFTTDNSGFSSDPALGNLVDTANDNDGIASYSFVAGDNGTIVLYLEDTVAETTNINLAAAGVFDDNLEGDITFRPFGFVFSPSPTPTQVAGRPFDMTLTAAGQTPAQLECGVIEEYDGVKSVNFWSDYSSPITSPTEVSVDGLDIATSEGTSAPQNVSFSNGVATITVQYDDAGEISLSAKDEIDIGEPPSGNLDEIIGGISPFVVRPFGYDIQIQDDPYANSGGSSVFRSSDQVFDMTLRSVIWQAADDIDNDGIPDPFVDTDADGIPDSGGDLSDNPVTPNVSNTTATIDLTATALVVTNSNGLLSTLSIAHSSFEAPGTANQGTYTFSQSWSEVGILQIDALTSDFSAGGEDVLGQRINIGRFIPDHYSITPPLLIEQCGSFSYAGFYDGVNPGLDKNGQPFDISGTVTAQNASNQTTLNYQDEFAKLGASDLSASAFDATNTAAASGRLNFAPTALSFAAGVTSFSDIAADYQQGLLTAPFNLRVDLQALDSDAVSSALVNSSEMPVRLGRLSLIDTYGPETSDLEMLIKTEYFDGSNWTLNSDDSCTSYIATEATFDLASYNYELNDGETNIVAPASSQQLQNGQPSASNGLWFSAPGASNFGSVSVEYDLTNQDWLQFDWNGDSTNNSPNATLNFGYYRGSDRVIYWKEVRN